jgi:hypothetical protein
MPAQLSRRAARVLGVLLALVAQGVALAGCGGSSHGNGIASKSPRAILQAAQTAAEGASSAHVVGSITRPTGTETFDIEILAGKGAHGSVTVEGATFDLIETAGTVYMKGNAAFYARVGGSAADKREAGKLLHGKWIKAPASAAQFAPLLHLADLHTLVSTSLAGHAAPRSVGTSVVNGTPVVGVADPSLGETVYVATSGTPYPVQIAKSGTDGGTITFGAWNGSVILAPPAHAIDITTLQPHG